MMQTPIFALDLLSVYGAFFVCFWTGLIFAVISGILSGVMHGVHADSSHIGAEGGGHEGGAGHTVSDFPAFSPVTISIFATIFGGMGMIFNKIPLLSPYYISVPLALLCALGGAYGVFLFFAKVFYAQQGSSEVIQSSLVGRSATVITPITPEGVGEIVYFGGGGQQNVQARSADGQPFANGTEVVIARIVGGTFYVRRKTEGGGSGSPPPAVGK